VPLCSSYPVDAVGVDVVYTFVQIKVFPVVPIAFQSVENESEDQSRANASSPLRSL
jgi:hypothetical protein